MNDAAKAWVAALRSGEYAQGRGSLRSLDGDRHCCLGVACQLSGLGEFRMKGFFLYMAEKNKPKVLSEEGRTGLLPDKVRRHFGLRSTAGGFEVEGRSSSLAGANDAGYSFDEIADLIEKHADDLFEPSLAQAEA